MIPAADRPADGALDAPWAAAVADVVQRLDVDPGRGLDPNEADRRLERHGPNRLHRHEPRSAVEILVDQFRSLVVLFLAAAGAVSLLAGHPIEAVAIAIVLVLNATIGFTTEIRAVRSMESLRELVRIDARVRRGGSARTVPADEVVPGDVLVLQAGDVVPADARIVEASRLELDESTLTGESAPIAKGAEPVAADTDLAERTSVVHQGSAVTRGSGVAVVVATGDSTELGRIAELTSEVEAERTPLDRRLASLGRKLIAVAVGCAGAIAVVSILTGRDVYLSIETAIALAVAAVPEGLPIVATIALAAGLWRMARRSALIERLAAVETLGSTDVILTDKTGTLTENRMTVVRVGLAGPDGRPEIVKRGDDGDGFPADAEDRLRRALEIGVLCNDADLDADGAGGDPLERALLAVGHELDVERDRLLDERPEIGREAFDPDLKLMATLHQDGDGVLVAVKGAPEAVLDRCERVVVGDDPRALGPDDREAWLEANAGLAEDGLRVLALAERRIGSADADPYAELDLVGLVGLLDPPREDVEDAIAAFRRAGIRIVVVTGDQPATARTVARAVGLAEDGAEVLHGREIRPVDELDEAGRERLLAAAILARTTPEQKLDLLDLHQSSGAIVAMIGDGVNDAPALRKADIGVAMGERGTAVAREAAAMVLEDDRLGTIVAAIEEGRIVFGNIRAFVVYLLSCNLSEILVVGLATAVALPLPILPLQILFLNLVTDVFPALALGVGKGDPGVLDRPPRPPDEGILTRRHWTRIVAYGLVLTAAVLAGLWAALEVLELPPDRAVTVSFLVLAFGQLGHVFNMPGRGSRPLVNEVSRNGWVWGALGLCTLLLVGVVYLPVVSDVLQLGDPGPDGWAVVAGLAAVPLVVGRVLAAIMAGRGSRG